jgi:hypothetical protein
MNYCRIQFLKIACKIGQYLLFHWTEINMSAIKLKNAVLKGVRAAIANGELPAIVVNATLKDRRIRVTIDAAPFDVIKQENLTLTKSGVGLKLEFGIDGVHHYTPEGIALEAKVMEIAKAICPTGVYVDLSPECFFEQGRRAKAAMTPEQRANLPA